MYIQDFWIFLEYFELVYGNILYYTEQISEEMKY